MSENDTLVTIRTMMGARNLETSLKCLGSIRRFCGHGAEILVHSDGTLGERECEQILGALGRVRFQERTESNEWMAETLKKYPRCLAFRGRHFLAMQVLDIPLLGPVGERVVYSDTDILYTRPITCRSFFLGGGLPFIGSKDVRDSYAVHLKRWLSLEKYGVRLTSRMCAGMVSYDREVHDLDYLEWLLRLDETESLFSAYPFFVSQTLIAALAGRVKAGWVEPKECVLAHQSNMKQARKASIVHFAGYSRNYLNEVYEAIDPKADEWKAKELSIVPAPICGLGRRVLSAARSRLFLREDPVGVR